MTLFRSKLAIQSSVNASLLKQIATHLPRMNILNTIITYFVAHQNNAKQLVCKNLVCESGINMSLARTKNIIKCHDLNLN